MNEPRTTLNSGMPIPFYLVSPADHRAPVTGLGSSPTVQLSKSGGPFAPALGGVAEIGDGWYQLTPVGADTGTIGPNLIHATGSGVDPYDARFDVVANLATWPLTPGTAAYPLTFLMVSSADHITGAAGLSPTVTIARIGSPFAPPAGAVVEIGYGWYAVLGNAADTGTLGPILLTATAAGADETDDRYEVALVSIAAPVPCCVATPSGVGRMRRPSGRLRVNYVTVQHVVDWSKGTAGGRLPAYGVPSCPVRCQVAATNAEDIADHMREDGVEYLTVSFTDPPGTRVRSLLNWIDLNPPKVLQVNAPVRISTGRFRSYLVDCVYVAGQDDTTPLEGS